MLTYIINHTPSLTMVEGVIIASGLLFILGIAATIITIFNLFFPENKGRYDK